MAKKPSIETQDFETALARLEKIVAEMETGKLNLDQMLAHFEEGSTLVAVCGKKLNEVEKKIEMLVSKTEPEATAPLSDGEMPASETATSSADDDEDDSLF